MPLRLKERLPVAFGAPAKFISFRPGQFDGIRRGVESSKRFVVQAIPTGGGKSLTAIVQALATHSRAAYLTSTKGLQDQLLSDFASIGLVDVRGQGNYRCIEVDDSTVNVDEGPCHFGYSCGRVERVDRRTQQTIPIAPGVKPCTYFSAEAAAKRAELVVTNYSYWLHKNKYGDGLGQFDLLILDEAHDIIEALSSFLSVEISAWEIEALLETTIPRTDDMAIWTEWATVHVERVTARLDNIKAVIRNDSSQWKSNRKLLRHLKRVAGKLEFISTAAGEWICERDSVGKFIRFNIVWPQDYAEAALFRNIPHVLMLSATVLPKTAELLGIKKDELAFCEYPHTFPLANRPTHCVDTVRLNFRSTPADLLTWVRRIDQIIDKRQDRKGIIHTVSYKRRDFLLQHSRFASLMVTHSRKDTADVVAKFQASTTPAVLVSPSVTTGYDFPDSQCEYQIIGKVPLPDMRAKVLKARKKRELEYDSYIAMQSIVQAAGRGVRSATDRCEVFIVDNHFADWFVWKYKHLCPKWFLESVTKHRTIPAPPMPPLLLSTTTSTTLRRRRRNQRPSVSTTTTTTKGS